MEFPEFYDRFGGSFRTDHLLLPPQQRLWLAAQTRVIPRAKRALRLLVEEPFGAAGRLRDRRVAAARATIEHVRAPSHESRPLTIRDIGPKRRYQLPRSSELPIGFVRLDPWEGEYLYMLAGRAARGILETGRLHGGSTTLLAFANSNVPIVSIDIAPTNDDGLRALLEAHGVGENLQLIVGDSQHTRYPEVGEIDLLFIDGDHSYNGVSADLTNWFPVLSPGGHVVLHDSYLGGQVQQAVIDFIRDRDVEVVRSPYIPARHWHWPTGSLAHFIKRG